jgi:hypothetical protein
VAHLALVLCIVDHQKEHSHNMKKHSRPYDKNYLPALGHCTNYWPCYSPSVLVNRRVSLAAEK